MLLPCLQPFAAGEPHKATVLEAFLRAAVLKFFGLRTLTLLKIIKDPKEVF